MRTLKDNEVAFVHGLGILEDIKTSIALLCGSTSAGGAAGHISGSILGYQLASSQGVGPVAAIVSGAVLGVGGAFAGAYLLTWANLYLYQWAKGYK